MRQGALHLEENYGVYFGNRPVGKVQVTRQGLYYHFLCRCELTGDVMCRLWVTCADKRESLGLADGNGIVHLRHLVFVQMPHVLPQAALVDGANLLQKDDGILA